MMLISARYIDVEWNATKQVQKVFYGSSIEIIKKSENNFFIETITFPKRFFYFAFRIEEPISNPPYFLFNEIKEDLLEIIDPKTGDNWWIAKGRWIPESKKRNYGNKYVHESFRTAGRLELHINDIVIEISNRTNNFSVEEMEFFLTDFKNELWSIILNSESVVNAELQKSTPNIFNEDTLLYVENCLNSIQKILNDPKFFLVEDQQLVIKKKVKPVRRTFRELTTKPNSKTFTSRIHDKSYDNSENRYIHFCTEKLFFIFNKMLQVVERSNIQFSTMAKIYFEESDRLKNSDFKIIDKDLFIQEAYEIKQRSLNFYTELEKLNNNLLPSFLDEILKLNSKILNRNESGNENLITYRFTLDQIFEYLDHSIQSRFLNGKEFETHPEYHIYNGKYLVVEFPDFIFNVLSKYINSDREISITGNFIWEECEDFYKFTCYNIKKIKGFDRVTYITHQLRLGKKLDNSNDLFFCNNLNGIEYGGKNKRTLKVKYPFEIADNFNDSNYINCIFEISGLANYIKYDNYDFLNWLEINSIKLIDSPLLSDLNKKRKDFKKYERANWQVAYDIHEKKDINHEARLLKHRAIYFENLSNKYSELEGKINSIINKVRKYKLNFRSLNVSKSSHFPNSMVFIQNPNYSSFYNSFKKFLLNSNLNLNQVDQLIEIEKMGLVNISKLYERWVLIKIIKILINDFGFSFISNWQDKLIKAIHDNQHDVEFKAEMPDRQINVTLTYEKVFSNDRRPDFVIDFEYYKYQYNKNNKEWYFEIPPSISRLVIDAKFFDDSSEDHINSTLDELVDIKGYDDNNINRVFIIHPGKGIIKRKTSPLIWSSSCDYGHNAKVINTQTILEKYIARTRSSNHKQGHICFIPSKSIEGSIDNLKRLLLLHIQHVTTVLYSKKENGIHLDWHNYFCTTCSANRDELIVTPKPTRKGISFNIKCKSCYSEFVENFCYNCKTRLFKNGTKWTYHRTYSENTTHCRCPNCNADLYQLTNMDKF